MSRLKAFLFPELNLKLVVRAGLVAAIAVFFFTRVLVPFHVSGHSMVPTYQDGDFSFCNRLHYVYTPLSRHDVVAIRYAGTRVMLLKRILAFEGETVEFRQGRLYVDGRPIVEPYVLYTRNWNLEPRVVSPGQVYVAGDNRGMEMSRHDFGQTGIDRIIGVPLW